MHGLGRSMLSMDTDGRVVRLETFSKILSPGLRIGWATGPKILMEQLVHFLMAASLGAPSLSQLLIARLLADDDPARPRKKHGGAHAAPSMFARQLVRVQAHYAHKASVLHEALCKHVGPGLASWQKPTAGMFMWLKLHGIEVRGATQQTPNTKTHYHYRCTQDVQEIWDDLVTHGIVGVPGRLCHPQQLDPHFQCSCMRLCFASASDEQLQQAATRLGEVLRGRVKT